MPSLVQAQANETPADAHYKEASEYPSRRRAELRAQGKQFDSEATEQVASQ
jgi:hypothetical protein